MMETSVAADVASVKSVKNPLIGFLILLFLVNAVLVGIMIVMYNNMAETEYFEHRNDGSVNPLYALDVPVVGASALLAWANEAAVSAYTYGFDNYEEALESARQYFTPGGWSEFQFALERSKVLSTVIDRKLKLSSVVNGATVIVGQGPVYGGYIWKVQLPLLVTFESGSELEQSRLLVTLVIARVPTRDVAKGIAITQFNTRPLDGQIPGT